MFVMHSASLECEHIDASFTQGEGKMVLILDP